MIEVKRKNGESTESMLRRFSQFLKWDGKLQRVKETRFKTSKKTKRLRKKETLFKITQLKKVEYLKKIGLLKPNEFKPKK